MMAEQRLKLESKRDQSMRMFQNQFFISFGHYLNNLDGFLRFLEKSKMEDPR